MNTKNNVKFKEVQKFKQIILWLVVIIPSGVLLYGVIQQVIFGKPFGDQPVSDISLIMMFVLIGLGLPVLFYHSKLITEVREDGIYFKFVPFHFKTHKFLLKDIDKYYIRNYSPIKEYGGWGIRFGPMGKAYNLYGNTGMQLELKNGKRILLGTQRPDEFKQAMDDVFEAAANEL